VALAQFEASHPHFPARVEQNHKYHARMDSVCGARFETWNLQNTGKCYQLGGDILHWLSRNVIFKASHNNLLKTGAVHLVKNTEHVQGSALLEYVVSLGNWFPVSSISVVPSSSSV